MRGPARYGQRMTRASPGNGTNLPVGLGWGFPGIISLPHYFILLSTVTGSSARDQVLAGMGFEEITSPHSMKELGYK